MQTHYTWNKLRVCIHIFDSILILYILIFFHTFWQPCIYYIFKAITVMWPLQYPVPEVKDKSIVMSLHFLSLQKSISLAISFVEL